MEITRLTSKCQATIPLKIRNFLGLDKGDAVAFEVENDKVIIRKAPALDKEYLKAVESTFTEWNSSEDEEAFKDW